MTNRNTRYDYENPNSHFRGVIYASDFDTTRCGSRNIAKRIESDLKFDEQCKRNEEARNIRMKGFIQNETKTITLHKNK